MVRLTSVTGQTANFPNLEDAAPTPEGRLRNGQLQPADFGPQGGISGWRLPVNALAGVFTADGSRPVPPEQAYVFPDEQLRGPVVELLARLLADVDPRGGATRAHFLGFGNIVNDALALQVRRQTSPTVALLLPTRHRLGLDRNRNARRGVFRGSLEERRLIGSEVLAFGTVEPTQELIEPLLHAAQFLIAIVQHREQFADHPLERLGVVRKCGVLGKRVRRGGIRAHAS